MSTAYVVLSCYHDYEASSSYPIHVTFDKPVAEKMVADMQARLAVRNAAQDAINQHMASYDLTNPKPHIRLPFNPKPLPNFGPKKKWTAEQKAQYTAVKKENKRKECDNMKPWRDWVEQRYQEILRITATYPQPIQIDLQNLMKDTFWEIEEVPFS